MNRRKILFAFTLVIILGVALAFVFVRFFKKSPTSAGVTDQPLLSAAIGTGAQPLSGNAFVGAHSSGVFLPAEPSGESESFSVANNSSASTPVSGTIAQNNTQKTIVSGPSGPTTATITPLSLPSIPDSEITISSSGVATALDYLISFNANAKKIAFGGKNFDSVLKDKNGVMLFVPDLIEKAIADNNFEEVTGSLKVQREFIEAETNFLKSMPVAGAAIAINKENIGLEELTDGVVSDALMVAAGTLPENDFMNYYAQYNAAAETARQSFSTQVGLSYLDKTQSFFSRVLAALGIGVTAKAQNAIVPFGGQIVFLQPCTCTLGFNVVLGPPVPADLYVDAAFLETPLFFSFKTMVSGAWWLGLYDPEIQIPCSQLPVCLPTDIGGLIIMTGTSIPSP